QIAKVLCFAIIKMASREQRKCFLISFSIGIKTINLLDLVHSLDQLVNFLKMSFHGGTDVTPAMIATIEMLQTNDYKDADVLIVSDFVMFEIKDEVARRMKEEQRKGTQFHSLTISKQANPEIIEKFDNNWIYHPEKRGIERQLLEDLRSIA
ncbi:MAG: VWA domain-containing protein, partial [Bacteroidota bacterium]